MKKTASVAMILAACLMTQAFAWGKKAEEKEEKSQVEKDVSDALESAGNGISKGIEAASQGIKKGVGKVKEKSEDGTKERAKEKAADIGTKIGDSVKSGVKKTEDAINNHSPKFLTGTLKVKGKGKNTTFTLKADDGDTYTVKPFSSSEDAIIKLSAYNKMKIKISGMLNAETNTITLTTYKLDE